MAFDDFGSGWTSLSVAIAAAAHTLGTRRVADWVENDPTCEFLGELGIDFVQGFLTGRPEPLDASR